MCDETKHLHDDANEPRSGLTPAQSPLDKRYRLGKLLGEGGMAQVLEASDRNLKRNVAVKFLHDKYTDSASVRERFIDEARIMASLDHPAILPIHQLEADEYEQCYYVMKQINGLTLKQTLALRAPAEIGSRPTLMRLLSIFGRVCEAVAVAHGEGIVHRDLKPANVMIDHAGSVFVLDWGIAKRFRETPDDMTPDKTRVGDILGTPAYMSPEQASGSSSDVDPQSDVFSLGVILYEILTGTKPFPGNNPREIVKLVVEYDPPEAIKVNPKAGRLLSAICMKALSKDPKHRYSSADELAADIRAVREFRPVSAVKVRLTDRVASLARRNPVPAAVAATLLLVALIGASSLVAEASAESVLKARAQEQIELSLERIADFDVEIAHLEGSGLESAGEQVRERRLDELYARRTEERRRVEKVNWAIIGFTVFSPDEQALARARDGLFERITRMIGQEDYAGALAAIDSTLRLSNERNLLGYSAQDRTRLNRLRSDVSKVYR